MTAARLPELPEPSTHVPHALHAEGRVWPETNCYVDLWVEVLNAVGVDPMAALAFMVQCDFDGEQWDFFKFPPEDLRRVYGIEVDEINVWRSAEDHVTAHLGLGHLLTIECDAMFLPDTRGVSYELEHSKTTIAPLRLDPDERHLVYFHNRGCYELSGRDYDGVLRNPSPWPPYVERIDLARVVRLDECSRRQVAQELLAEHLGRRPRTNPVRRMGEQILRDVPWLQDNPPEAFHRYAFGTLRQCGAWAELLADFLDWLSPSGLHPGSGALRELASMTKACQFTLARVAHGRDADLGALFESMAQLWETGYGAMADVG